MSYCTQDDLKTAFGEEELIQLTDHAGAGVIDPSVLVAALAKADAEINQRLRVKGWSLPLELASADLINLAKDMTRFHLHSNVVPDPVQKAYDRALKTLDDYVKGLIQLDIGLPNTFPASAGDVDFTERERIFSEDSLAGF
jgi:phage gp36-like protein